MEADISPRSNSTAASKQRRDLGRSPVVIAVCGAKGMGKSSLARLLTNRLLNCCQVRCRIQEEMLKYQVVEVQVHFNTDKLAGDPVS